MLIDNERDRVKKLFSQLAESPKVTADGIASLLLRLPRNPDAVSHLLQLARDRDLPCRNLLIGTVTHLQGLLAGVSTAAPAVDGGAGDLESILTSDQPYPAKVQALIQLARSGDGLGLPVVRKLIGRERNVFVLATMASYLGRLGESGDFPLLAPLLGQEDHRVVANALEALFRLGIDLPASRLASLLERDDPRVRTNALALLARSDPGRVLETLPGLLRSQDLGMRGAVAHLLGQLRDQEGAIDLLVTLLETETRAPVLRQVAGAIKLQTGRRTAARIVGPLVGLRDRTDGSKRSLVQLILHEVAVDVGWTEAEINEAARAWAARPAPTGSRPDPVDPAPSGPDAGPDTGPDTGPVPDDRSPTASPPPPPPPPPATPVPPAHAGPETRVLPVPPPDQDRPAALPDAGVATPPAPPATPVPIPVLRPSSETRRINLAEELAGSDEDVPLSFSAVWGDATPSPAGADPAPGSGKKRPTTRTQVMAVPQPPVAGRRRWLLPVLAASLVLVTGIALGLQEEGEALAGPSSGGRIRVGARPELARREVRKTGLEAEASPGPGAGGAEEYDPREGPRHMGPRGASLDVEGTVVGHRREGFLLRAKGRFYFVRGSAGQPPATGETCRARGTLGGVAPNGLIYLDQES